jgi:hypothetical protein
MLKLRGFVRVTVALAAVLALSYSTFAQQGGSQPGTKAPAPEGQAKKSQPFDPHDLNGVWQGRLENPNTGIPPRTPAGEAAYKANKPAIGPTAVPLVNSNDPVHICDPQGIPRDLINIVRPIQFIQTKTQMVQLFLWNEMWRIIWTDGRSLPVDAVELPRWTGYSVGHWAGDTFVVETSGLDERSWLDAYGDPHSDIATLEERYHRVDYDTLELTMTITDPKMYTKPWVTSKEIFKLKPELELELQEICTPSEMSNYQKVIVEPEDAK